MSVVVEVVLSVTHLPTEIFWNKLLIYWNHGPSRYLSPLCLFSPFVFLWVCCEPIRVSWCKFDTNENRDATCGFMSPVSANLGGNPLYVYTASHRSRATQCRLFDWGILVLKVWPAHVPDLNIIVQMWTELKRKVRQKNPRNLEGMSALSNTE